MELKAFLDMHCLQNGTGKTFSDDIFKVLVKKLDKNQQLIPINEFLDFYVEGEIRIKNKLNQVAKMMTIRQEKKEQNKQRLKEVSGRERLNEYGVMQGSKLEIILFEA